MSRTHPVIRALMATRIVSERDLDFLLDKGRAYVGAPLPSGIRQRAPGRCFEVAEDLEADGYGTFVRGFALRPGSSEPMKHAWVSRDGRTVIDPSWTRQTECSYFGVPGLHYEARLRAMTQKGLIQIPSLSFGF